MDPYSTYPDIFAQFVHDQPQAPQDVSLASDPLDGETAKSSFVQDVPGCGASFDQNAITATTKGFGNEEDNFDQAANASTETFTSIVSSSSQPEISFTEDGNMGTDPWPHAGAQDDAQDWDGYEDTFAHDLPNIYQTASKAPQHSFQSTRGNQLSNGNIDGTKKLTSDRVLRRLESVRYQAVQPAVTIFQTQDAAKAWRKRGQNQVIQSFQDASFPSSPAEERDYVNFLKRAFKYLGTGCKYTEQERLFVTQLDTDDGNKDVESWCWRLLKQMIRRQSQGRPTDMARRKSASLDTDLQTFAERFAAVFNALRLEKRCCIRFSNIADWHKRLANDPVSEVADIHKNDMINDKRAHDRKAKHAEAKALAKALEDEKSKAMGKKRNLEDGQGFQASDSLSTSAFSSRFATSEKNFTSTHGRSGRNPPVRRRNGSGRTQPSQNEEPMYLNFGPNGPDKNFSAKPAKRAKLDNGSTDNSRISI